MADSVISPTPAGWVVTVDGISEEIEDDAILAALDAIDAGERPLPLALDDLQYEYPGARLVDTNGIDVGEIFPESD